MTYWEILSYNAFRRNFRFSLFHLWIIQAYNIRFQQWTFFIYMILFYACIMCAKKETIPKWMFLFNFEQMTDKYSKISCNNKMSFFPGLVNDIQSHRPHPSPTLPSKWAVPILWFTKLRNVLNRRRTEYSDFCEFQFLRYDR